MKIQHVIKVIMASFAIVGVVLGYFEHKYQPQAILLANSPEYPDWLSWFGFGLLSISAIGYALIDVAEFFAKKSKEKREKWKTARNKHQPPYAP